MVTREAFRCQVWAKSKSLSLKELGKPAECTRRPLFSTVLSQGLMIHVLIHVLCWGSHFSCSQHCIIKALCALTFPLPPFGSFPLICFSVSPLHNLGSFCLWMVSLVVCILYSFPSSILPLLNLSEMEISINVVFIYRLIYHNIMILLGEKCAFFHTLRPGDWVTVCRSMVITTLCLCLHACYIRATLIATFMALVQPNHCNWLLNPDVQTNIKAFQRTLV